GKLGEQALGTCALHALDQATDRDVRRDGDHHMPMIRRDMPLQDIDASFLTLFTDESAHPFCHLATQDFVAILGDPDDVQVDREGRRRTTAIVTHAPECIENLLKLPPKGGGFAPPNWRQ